MDRKRTREQTASQRQASEVLEGLDHGLTLNQMTASPMSRSWRPDGHVKKVVQPSRIWNFMRLHPALGKRMKAHSKKNALVNLRASCQSKRIIAAPAIMLNHGLDAFDAVTRACAHLWEGERGDVRSLMLADVAENKLKLSDCAARVHEYRTRHNRRPRSWGDYSLDAMIGDGTTTWLDTKSDEDRLWGLTSAFVTV
jgi:hypothetical protein